MNRLFLWVTLVLTVLAGDSESDSNCPESGYRLLPDKAGKFPNGKELTPATTCAAQCSADDKCSGYSEKGDASKCYHYEENPEELDDSTLEADSDYETYSRCDNTDGGPPGADEDGEDNQDDDDDTQDDGAQVASPVDPDENTDDTPQQVENGCANDDHKVGFNRQANGYYKTINTKFPEPEHCDVKCVDEEDCWGFFLDSETSDYQCYLIMADPVEKNVEFTAKATYYLYKKCDENTLGQEKDADDEHKRQTKHKAYDPFNLPPCPHGDIKLCDDEGSLLINDRFSDNEVEDCEDCKKDSDQPTTILVHEAQTGGDEDNGDDDAQEGEGNNSAQQGSENNSQGNDDEKCKGKPETECKGIQGCTWEKPEEDPDNFACYKETPIDDDDENEGEGNGQNSNQSGDNGDQNGEDGGEEDGAQTDENIENSGTGSDDPVNQPEKSLSEDPHTMKLYEKIDGVQNDIEDLDNIAKAVAPAKDEKEHESDKGEPESHQKEEPSSSSNQEDQASVANSAVGQENMCKNLPQDLCEGEERKHDCRWERLDESDTNESPACYLKTLVHMDTKNGKHDLQENLTDSDDNPHFDAIKLYAGFILVLLGAFTVVMGWSWHKSVVESEMVEALLEDEAEV